MRVAVLGSGQVGQVLADAFVETGHQVIRGSRDPKKLEAWPAAASGRAGVSTFQGAAAQAEVIVLAVKGDVALDALQLSGPENLVGKVVIDPTNPIASAPPEDGVLSYFTGPNSSLMEMLQTKVPEANFVKCFSCVGNALMFRPKLPGGPPTMFICGNDESAKGTVKTILGDFGWEAMDLGTAKAARAIEPLCMLWCIPGFREHSWSHALKLLRP
jgi:8-hydroxy-5-deazaflavin:NADPH oxidoreductase